MATQNQASDAMQDGPEGHKLIGLKEDAQPGAGITGFIPPPVQESVAQFKSQAQDAFNRGSKEVGRLYVETIEPTVGPALNYVRQKHAEYPDSIEIMAAILAIFYGGCFPRLVLLYVVTKNIDSVAAVWARFYKVYEDFTSAEGSLRDKVAALGSCSKPQELSKLMSDIALHFCYFAAVLTSPVCAAPVVGGALFNQVQATCQPRVVAALKQLPQFNGELGAKWAPFASKWAHITGFSMIAYLIPSCAAAFVIGFEAGARMVEKYSEGRKESMKAEQIVKSAIVVATLGTGFQLLYGFGLGSGWVLLPFRLVLIPARVFNAALTF